MTYALDTDMFTLAYYGRHGVRERVAAERTAHPVAVSAVTRYEVLRGRFEAILKAPDAAALARAVDHLRASEAHLGEFPTLPFDAASLAEFDRIRTDKATRRIGRADQLIASVARSAGVTLVTRNTKSFAHGPGLTLANWAD